MNRETLGKICLEHNYAIIEENHGKALILNETLYKELYKIYKKETDLMSKATLQEDLDNLKTEAEFLKWNIKLNNQEDNK